MESFKTDFAWNLSSNSIDAVFSHCKKLCEDKMPQCVGENSSYGELTTEKKELNQQIAKAPKVELAELLLFMTRTMDDEKLVLDLGHTYILANSRITCAQMQEKASKATAVSEIDLQKVSFDTPYTHLILELRNNMKELAAGLPAEVIKTIFDEGNDISSVDEKYHEVLKLHRAIADQADTEVSKIKGRCAAIVRGYTETLIVTLQEWQPT